MDPSVRCVEIAVSHLDHRRSDFPSCRTPWAGAARASRRLPASRLKADNLPAAVEDFLGHLNGVGCFKKCSPRVNRSGYSSYLLGFAAWCILSGATSAADLEGESDACLVVVTVFKTVAPTLVSGGRFDSYPLHHFFLHLFS
jgi:hypothetical protein